MTAIERELEQYGTVDFFNYRKMLIPGFLGQGRSLPSSRLLCSPLARWRPPPSQRRPPPLSCCQSSVRVTQENQNTPAFLSHVRKAVPWVVERHLVYLQVAGEGMVPHSVLLVLFLMEVLGKVPEVHGGGEEVVQVSQQVLLGPEKNSVYTCCTTRVSLSPWSSGPPEPLATMSVCLSVPVPCCLATTSPLFFTSYPIHRQAWHPYLSATTAPALF